MTILLNQVLNALASALATAGFDTAASALRQENSALRMQIIAALKALDWDFEGIFEDKKTGASMIEMADPKTLRRWIDALNWFAERARVMGAEGHNIPMSVKTTPEMWALVATVIKDAVVVMEKQLPPVPLLDARWIAGWNDFIACKKEPPHRTHTREYAGYNAAWMWVRDGEGQPVLFIPLETAAKPYACGWHAAPGETNPYEGRLKPDADYSLFHQGQRARLQYDRYHLGDIAYKERYNHE